MQTIPLYGAARPLFADCLVELTSTSFKTSFSHGPSRLILSTKVLNRGARTLACSYDSAGKAANNTDDRGAKHASLMRYIPVPLERGAFL